MQKALSTHIFVNQRLTVSMLERIEKAGIELLEIFCARQHFDYHDDNQVREIAAWFRDSRLKLHSIHTPMYRDLVWGRSGPHAVVSIAEIDKARRIAACDEIKRALELADYIPFRYAVTHMGVSGEYFDERKMEAAFSSVEHLRMFARQRGADLLLENIPNELTTPERLVWFLQYTHMRDLGFCFDIGHAHLSPGVAASFAVMGPHVRSTHLHDNFGEKDEHLYPLNGNIDWPAALRGFRAYPDAFPLLLEIREFPELERPLDNVNEVFDKFEQIERVSVTR